MTTGVHEIPLVTWTKEFATSPYINKVTPTLVAIDALTSRRNGASQNKNGVFVQRQVAQSKVKKSGELLENLDNELEHVIEDDEEVVVENGGSRQSSDGERNSRRDLKNHAQNQKFIFSAPFPLKMVQTMEAQPAQQPEKWKGAAITELTGAKAEQIWPLLEDFFGLDMWFPTLSTCLPVEGVSGKPGCVRFCAGFRTPVDGSERQTVNWTKQKLIFIDPTHMTYSYSIIDGNVGFYSYVSTVTVLPKEDGCEIQWLYEVEPVEGWKLEDLDYFISTGLNVMARRMEVALQAMEGGLTASMVKWKCSSHCSCLLKSCNYK
ncbi:hypothetical protein L6164_007530 [Bauhinia variegata]|uniref:Uncharacterized protein n=1 Tax=Bauhinia variegata TaxID=167791 RepID=A0ACB9PGN5_BAUVA|nr:hypothetical protein L6164_007530 [Bauhinia variegata]